MTVSKLEDIFTESIYNEEICIFREDGHEYMLVIKKPTIEYKNLSKKFSAFVFPASDAQPEELSPEDVTYNEIMSWLYEGEEDWESRAIEYIETFDKFSEIASALATKPTKKVFVLNKYEDLRSYGNEQDRYREFPCKNH